MVWVEVVKARGDPAAVLQLHPQSGRGWRGGEQTSGVAPSHRSEHHPALPGVGAAEGGDATVAVTIAHTAREVTR